MDLAFNRAVYEGRMHTILTTWAKMPCSLMDRAWEVYKICRKFKYDGLPDKPICVRGVGYTGQNDDQVEIIGYAKEYVDVYDETGHMRFYSFTVPLSDFLEPKNLEAALEEQYRKKQAAAEEARRIAEDKEYAEYLRLKSKYEKAV